MFHPAFHNRAALQTSIYVSADGIPGLGAMGHLGTSRNTVWVSRGLDESIQTTMPEMVVLFVTLKDKLVPHIVAGAHARTRVGTILLLQLWIEFLVNHGHLYFVLHINSIYQINEIYSSLNAFSFHSWCDVLPSIWATCHRSKEPKSNDNSRQWHALNGLPSGRQSRLRASVGIPAALRAFAYFLAVEPNTFSVAIRVTILSMRLPNHS